MSLQIRLECPQCKQIIPLNMQDLAPGHRQVCRTCQTPARMTQSSLEHFSKDLHLYFQN